jgi:hypothetical protein
LLLREIFNQQKVARNLALLLSGPYFSVFRGFLERNVNGASENIP